jgi:ABC-type transport system involved in multi-copper enzyme maturation permease subunit
MRSLVIIGQLSLLTFKDGLRRRTLPALFGLALLFLGANVMVTAFFTWDLGKVAVEFGLATVALTGLLLIFFTATKLLADDLEHHKVYFVMSRPVSPWQYILGKFCGLALLLLLVALILGAASALSVQYAVWRNPGFIPVNFSWGVYLLALAFQWFSLLIMLAVTMFWFNFASQSLLAIALSAGTYLIGQNMNLLRQLVRAEDTPAMQQGIIIALSWLFPNLSFFDLKATAAYGLSFSGPQLLAVIGYGIAYTGLLLFAAKFFFGRKELL